MTDHLTTSRRVYERLVRHASTPAPAMRAWDGTVWGPPDAASTIVLRHEGALRSLLLPPSDLAAGEAYIFDDVDVEGDITHAIAFATSLRVLARRPLTSASLLGDLMSLPHTQRNPSARPSVNGRLHSRNRDRQAVTSHYDTSNDFFSLFLDPALVYSCAYFLDPDEPLATAQRRKLDVVCRKLDLAHGGTLLDIGCGWGALVIHAAVEYGVRATGITLSEPQADLARLRAAEAGVGDRVDIRMMDYREVSGRYDAVASVGMVEHVGEARLDGYFRRLRSLVAPEGSILNHGITDRTRQRRPVHAPRRLVRPPRRRSFVNTYVFPDGELVPVETVVATAERNGLEVRDAESLRAGYALTLRRWVDTLESNRGAAVATAGETAYRIWRLYMAGSALAFERGDISVYQLLLSPPARPWTFGRQRLLASDDADHTVAAS